MSRLGMGINSAIYLLFTVVLAGQALGQIMNLDETTMPPVPGAGHNYIKMFGETVNPATGSVSLRIDIPMPKGRGLDIPFAILYSSSGVQHVIGNTNGGGGWGSDTGYNNGSGWSVTVPNLTVVQGIDSQYNPGPPPATYSCYYYYSFVMHDWSGAAHTLPLEAAQDPNAGSDQCYESTNRPGSILSGSEDFYQGITWVPANFLVSPPVNVAGPDGTVYGFGVRQTINANGVTSFQLSPYSIEDRNGNEIAVSIGSGTNGVYGGALSDSLGRGVTIGSGIGRRI
jgi:hypothetical protein